MLLAINANNTNVKFALFNGENISAQWRISTDVARTADEYAAWLTQMMQIRNISFTDIKNAIIATVVPRALFEFKLLCRSHFNCDPVVIGEKSVELGIDVLIDNPQEAGADRLVNAVAGHKLYGGPLIIVDFGTSTTFDIVNERGSYVGGIIAPGVNLSIEALYQRTARLPHIACERPETVIGKNTVDAMKSGVFWGYVGLIEGIVSRIRKEYGDLDMRIVVTGGLAPLFKSATDVFNIIDPNLTLRGMLMIYRRNTTA